MAFTRDYSAMFAHIQENQIKAKELSDNKSKTQKKSYVIEGEFKPKLDEKGHAEIDLRFLPSIATETMPYVESWEHLFVNGSTAKQPFWSVKCRKIMGKDAECPVCKENRRIYKKYGGEKNNTQAQNLSHGVKKNYYANVYILQNDNDPETEGRVFVLKFGPQIMKLINELSEATSSKEDGLMPAVNAFDVSRSVTLHWVIQKQGKIPKYDGTKFYRRENMVTPLCDKNDRILTEAELEDIENALYALEPLVPKFNELPSYENIVKWHYTQCGTQFGYYEDDEIHEDEVVKVGENKFELRKNLTGEAANQGVETSFAQPQTNYAQQPLSPKVKSSIDEMVSNNYSSNAFMGVQGGFEEEVEPVATQEPTPSPAPSTSIPSDEGMSEKQKNFWAKFNKMKQ